MIIFNVLNIRGDVDVIGRVRPNVSLATHHIACAASSLGPPSRFLPEVPPFGEREKKWDVSFARILSVPLIGLLRFRWDGPIFSEGHTHTADVSLVSLSQPNRSSPVGSDSKASVHSSNAIAGQNLTNTLSRDLVNITDFLERLSVLIAGNHVLGALKFLQRPMSLFVCSPVSYRVS